MAKKNSISRVDSERPTLLVSKSEAKEKLQEQIERGKELKSQEIPSVESLEETRNEFYRWDTFNGNLLRALFSTDEYQQTYHLGFGGVVDHRSLADAIKDLRDDINYAIRKVQNVYDAIDLIVEDVSVYTKQQRTGVGLDSKSARATSKRVFIVHGHDDVGRLETARLLEQLKLDAVILGERDDVGRTIIEKFEHYSDVVFAVVLLTPDDLGSSQATFNSQGVDGLVKRARQNVIFEMGFFYAKLTRSHVCMLLKGETERPTDIAGVVYTPMDDGGAWKLKLAREMRAAGLPVDLNDLQD